MERETEIRHSEVLAKLGLRREESKGGIELNVTHWSLRMEEKEKGQLREKRGMRSAPSEPDNQERKPGIKGS